MGDATNNGLKLQDIHLPDSPGFWPLAPGWWILLVLLLLLGIWLLLKLMRRARLTKKRQQILNEYSRLEARLLDHPDNEVIANINIFLRQLAISKYPRADIASLAGANWLAFLDESGDTNEFSKGAGRILVDAPYQAGELKNLNRDEFAPLIRRWIKKIEKRGGVVI